MQQNFPYYSSQEDEQTIGFFTVIAQQIGALCGLALLAAIIFMGLALVSWHVGDPSLSYATDHPIQNWMGWPGAVAADLLVQFLGLASVGLLLPPFFWAALLMAQKRFRHLIWRFLCWFVASWAFAICLSLIPPFAFWPMPMGLGGIVGDESLTYLLGFFPTMPLGIRYGLVVLVFAPLTLWAWLTSGRPSRPRKSCSKPPAHQESDANFVEGEDETSGLSEKIGGKLVAFSGGILHFFYWIKNCFPPLTRRGFYRSKKVEDEARVEPCFASVQAVQSQFLEAQPLPMRGRRAVQKVDALAGDSFALPLLDYLGSMPGGVKKQLPDHEFYRERARELETVLEDFGVRGEIIHFQAGPVVTLYEFEPAPGIKSSRIIGLADDIARSMSAISARVAVISGRNVIGIELPHPNREMVYLRQILEAREFSQSKFRLALALGKTINGEAVVADLAKMPHLLVAGTTGSGKSVAINTMILSLLYRMTPEECRLIMVDPKMLELSVYDGIPHLLTPVVTDPKKAVVALKWAVREMEERYRKMSKLGVRNIEGFNAKVNGAAVQEDILVRTLQTGFDPQTGEPVFESESLALHPMPYIVVIIDEMADLMLVAGKDIESAVQRLAQMARAAGIHLIMATQRPSVDVITGTIKANFPTRISFQVTSKIDSRTILGEQGAEQLLGQGDMLFMMGGGRVQRVHGPFVGDEEVERVVGHLKAQGAPDYCEAVVDDREDELEGTTYASDPKDLYAQAVAVVLRDRKASTSYIQRRLNVGYNRAASLIERMEEEGLISPANHVGKREILVEGEDSF
ncbi:DNA translocase FtsK [Bartonella sp. DGB2]|uniref:DNA translocase FtsK n=1 Tax=Bartonella sp. DGB2 TaxID=3388426 RepID=UPI00398FBF64